MGPQDNRTGAGVDGSAATLRSYLEHERTLQSVVTYTKHRFDAATALTAHNWEHIYRDTLNAIVIGEAEGADMGVVLPAIVMHDIGFLYGPVNGHGPRGADRLAAYLAEAGISYSPEDILKQAACIRTHKGSTPGSTIDQHPEGLEAKVVADADLLEKFGWLGVYQSIRSFGELNRPLAKLIEFVDALSEATMCTETGSRLAEPGRAAVAEFSLALKNAVAPYGDLSP